MAEIELAMLAQQCLDRRLADQATLGGIVKSCGWPVLRDHAATS
jgi:hypothetical protein